MQHEVLAVIALERVDDLLVLAGAERGNHHGLGFAACEQGRTMGARQDADFRDDRTHRLAVAAVDALAGIEDGVAHDVLLELLELLLDQLGLEIFRDHLFERGVLHVFDLVAARLLVHFAISGAQIGLGKLAQALLGALGGFRLRRQDARLLRRLLGQADDRVDDRLETAMAEHDRVEHLLLGQFLGFGFDHQHAFLGAGDHQVEAQFRQLVDLRIEHVLAIDEADARRGDRAHEGNARDRQRGGGADHGDDVRIVLQVMGDDRADDLGLVAEQRVEQRADRAVDQAGGENLLLGRTAFALEEATGDLAGGETFFLVVDREREKINSSLRLFGGDRGAEHDGFAIGHEHGPVRLAGDMAGFQGELAPAPHDFLLNGIKHNSSFRPSTTSHRPRRDAPRVEPAASRLR